LKEKELSLTNQFNKDKETIQGELDKLNENFNKLQEDYSSLETTSQELEQFKATIIKEQRETAETEIFERFSDELTVEEMNPIREKSAEFTLEEIEDKLFALAGRKKVKFSTTQKQGRIKMGVFQLDNNPQSEKDIWTEQKEKFGSK
jgi:DNA repair ATPase RecN